MEISFFSDIFFSNCTFEPKAYITLSIKLMEGIIIKTFRNGSMKLKYVAGSKLDFACILLI